MEPELDDAYKPEIIETFKMKFEELGALLFSENQNITKEKIKNLWQTLNKELIALCDEYNNQIVGNKILLKKLAGLSFARGLDKALMSVHGNLFTAVAADLILNPDPVEIPCIYGLTFKVGVNDILLIKSSGRKKTIYLKKKFKPVQGGDEQNIIIVNNNELNFVKLLKKIQQNGDHILRVSLSYALNIHQYLLSEPNTFKLLNAPNDLNSKFLKIKTDKFFDVNLYHKRLMEIDRLKCHFKDFEVNLNKVEEINRYKISQGIT